MLKISIIIPIYNSDKFLTKCLDSVSRQTYKNLEVLCINDGSTDSSEKIIDNFVMKDKRFIHIKKSHTNAGDARNIGILKANGDFITFLDSDDFFEPDIMEQYIKVAQTTNPDIIISKYKLFDNNKNKDLVSKYGIHTKKRNVFSISDLAKRKFSFTNIAVWNKLYKTSFIRNNNITFKSHQSLNDMFFGLLSIALARRIALCKSIGTHYRINVKNSISENILDISSNFFNVLSEINDRLLLEKSWPNIKSDLLLVEKEQLLEFYNRFKYTAKYIKESERFKGRIQTFLKHYNEKQT